MRFLPSIGVAVLLAIATGCSRPNLDFCCVTADTCAAAGLAGELRPCGVGQACNAYECVAAECTSAADCTSPEAPMCLGGLCVAGCTVNDDCAGVAGRPRCDATDATCVGCTSSDQCPADRSICDADTRSCRGCTADDQCASGVCIEATGACAADDEIIYVMESGVDTGTCPRSAPCLTLSFAMNLTSPTRNVIRVLGSHFYLGNNTVFLRNSIVIDGNNTMLTSGVSTVTPAISAGGPATLEGVRLSSTDFYAPLISVSAAGALKLAQVTIETGQLEVLTGGKLEASNIELVNGNFECESGSDVVLRQGRFDRSFVDSACSITMSGSYLEPPPAPYPFIRFQGGLQRIENNVFVGTSADAGLILISGFFAGSSFRFNTVVNVSSVTGSAWAVVCAEGLDVTSNIIAYNSSRPISCVPRNSLFDAAGVQEVKRGTGNRSADEAIFKNRQARDFHLVPNSPALGFGEPGLVTIDLDGNARPMPSGTLPDVGAYEAP